MQFQEFRWFKGKVHPWKWFSTCILPLLLGFSLFPFFFFNIFTRQWHILVAALRIFVEVCRLSYSIVCGNLSSQTRDRTHISCIGFLTNEPPGEAQDSAFKVTTQSEKESRKPIQPGQHLDPQPCLSSLWCWESTLSASQWPSSKTGKCLCEEIASNYKKTSRLTSLGFPFPPKSWPSDFAVSGLHSSRYFLFCLPYCQKTVRSE